MHPQNEKTMGEQKNDIAQLMALLHEVSGAEYARLAEKIACRKEFYPVEGETGIFACGGETDNDFGNLLNAARKVVAHGYEVFILPNPKGIRTADFIFKKRNIYKVYDLKTIQGKSSASNRLFDSIGQTKNVVFNVRSNYDARQMGIDIKDYFEVFADAREVIVLKGKKMISVKRNMAISKLFPLKFRRLYEK